MTLTSSDTGLKVAEVTNAKGEFVFPALLPGRYSIVVEMKGFKRAEKTDLNLSAEERLPAGEFVLEVGDLTEFVTVSAAGTPVQVASSDRGALLTRTGPRSIR